MIDINIIRTNKELVKENIRNKKCNTIVVLTLEIIYFFLFKNI